tara:strand:+ start:186 stop:296 length:111 start_codon:yes stop_codon:yes gene_type:complete
VREPKNRGSFGDEDNKIVAETGGHSVRTFVENVGSL